MYGFRTAAGTCQEIRICDFGSAPKARWRPNGTTAEPGTFVRVDADADTEGFAPGVPGSEQPVSSPPATAPAVTSVRRRVSLARRYSCCSAMLIRRASCGGMPKSGTSMVGKVPSGSQQPPCMRVNGG